MFYSTTPHYCPICPAKWSRKGMRRIDPELVLEEENYSGYGVSIASCPRCNRRFQISYKVDTVIDVTRDLEESRDDRS